MHVWNLLGSIPEYYPEDETDQRCIANYISSKSDGYMYWILCFLLCIVTIIFKRGIIRPN